MMTRRINYDIQRIFAHYYGHRAQKMDISNDEQCQAAERQVKIREKYSSAPEGRREKVEESLQL